MPKFLFRCWECGELHKEEELPSAGPYYRGEVDSQFAACKNCGGQVRSRTGKVMMRTIEAEGGDE